MRPASLTCVRGARVSLRPLRPDDAAQIFAVFSDPEVMKYRDGVRLQTPADADAYIAGVHEYAKRGELFEWGIADLATDRVLGTCTMLRLDERHGRAEIGFALSRARWGQGLAREAVSLLISFAFGELALHRLEADVDPRNEPSLRLMERLGFTREGLLRERYRGEDEMQDAVVFGLLRHEWPARHGETSLSRRRP